MSNELHHPQSADEGAGTAEGAAGEGETPLGDANRRESTPADGGRGDSPDRAKDGCTGPENTAPFAASDRPRPPEDEDATQLGPPISVAVIDGPDRGKRRQIRGARMVVGRGEACDLRLTDGSVSRRHLELVVGAGGLVVRDLGSNNGTTVNGAKVPEAQVKHRDKIGLGATVLSVIDEFKELKESREAEEREREAQRAKPAPPPSAPRAPSLVERARRNPIAVAGLAVAAAALFLGGAVRVLRRPAAPVRATAKAEPTPAPAEVRAAEALAAAHRHAEAGDLEKAIAAARQVEAESSRFEEAKALAAKWAAALEAQRRERFKAALEAGDLASARALVASLQAEEREAAFAQIQAAEQQLEQRRAEEKLAARRQGGRSQEDVRRARDQIDQVLSGVVRKMDVGNFRGALGELERVAESNPPAVAASKIQLLQEKLPRFVESYSDGAAKYDAGNLVDAAGPLLRALILYEDMDLAGKLDASLRERAARSLAARARAAGGHREWSSAERDYRAALRIWPGLEEATDGLAEQARRRR